jgi:hypothetical protein
MEVFSTLINIDHDLRRFFNEVEIYLSITLDRKIIEKIFQDAENDQVNEKEYQLYIGAKRIFNSPIKIFGKVDSYEPSDIWIEIQNIKKKDLKYLQELVDV